MTDSSRERVTDNDRRLVERGMVRFEVIGRDADRELIRSLARRLAEDGPHVDCLRTVVKRGIADEPSRKGGILEALRRSPIVGENIVAERSLDDDREIDL